MVSIMGMLAVCVLVCAVMVQIKAAAVQDADVKKSEATNDLVKRSRPCGYGWTQIHDRCFRYIPVLQTWSRAERDCRSKGATLASVHDIQEYHEIQRLILTATHSYQETWIGGSDAQEEGLWLWSDGSAFHYTNWCGSHINHGRNWNCLRMNHSGGKCWDDYTCQTRLPYVCAKNM
ncbi:type-2 ice-structuring protein isoform X1 [Oryzias melastigma]|uniref:type-2 ice-structuring protein isoform X1 n=1 Tax=Oryzias melastigma TaxID=30732 RepID=UPI000CF823AF|nr:type-2 ice-structuring protein isoform X1 [Oryzias melastigma]